MSDRPLWHGRLSGVPSEVLWRFTVDHSDRRLLVDDVEGSIGHVAMLAEAGIISAEDQAALTSGLRTILAEARSGSFSWRDGDEDVHSAVERRLGELAGPVAGRLHTGRSRNDQIALDLRLYLRRAAAGQIEQLRSFAAMLTDRAEEHADTIVASYTHLQQAQAVSLGHHLLAYAWMALRDAERFGDLNRRLRVSPLGAGASGGSSLPLRPDRAAAALGFDEAFTNSMDAVADRDLAAEFVFAAGQAMVHLSRLAEDLILWATSEFGWVTFADELTTGSSALPQKKNPDIAELVRGRAAASIGDVAAILALQKGLPLTYNRDLQEDKRLVFHADDSLAGSLEAIGALVASAVFHPPEPGPWVGALDLAEVLVARGVPFREAHAAVGSLVTRLLGEGRRLDEAESGDLLAAHPHFDTGDTALLTVSGSMAARISPGGGSPDSVRAQVASLREMLR